MEFSVLIGYSGQGYQKMSSLFYHMSRRRRDVGYRSNNQYEKNDAFFNIKVVKKNFADRQNKSMTLKTSIKMRPLSHMPTASVCRQLHPNPPCGTNHIQNERQSTKVQINLD